VRHSSLPLANLPRRDWILTLRVAGHPNTREHGRLSWNLGAWSLGAWSLESICNRLEFQVGADLENGDVMTVHGSAFRPDGK
jgi:hypothetical protein